MQVWTALFNVDSLIFFMASNHPKINMKLVEDSFDHRYLIERHPY